MSSCGIWKDRKFCEPTSIYASFMQKTCPASCGLCEGYFVVCSVLLGRGLRVIFSSDIKPIIGAITDADSK